MTQKVRLEDGMKATGAVAMWKRIVETALREVQFLLPPGSKVVEVGYGDGLLTCYLARKFGWKITGFEVLPRAHEEAIRHSREFGVDSLLDLRLVKPDETWTHEGQYDVVFIKTVLYNARTLEEYGRWLDWVVAVLRPGGIFINFENGKANRLTYLYRRLRRRYYTNLCMYDSQVEKLYRDRFSEISLRYYGSLSQFTAPIPPIYFILAAIEENIFVRTADNSYVAAIVARKGEPLK